MYKKFSVILMGLLTLVWACEETPSSALTQADRDREIIFDYLQDQGIDMSTIEETEDGAYYRYLVQNSDNETIQDSLVIGVGYTGKLFYGDIFDSSELRDDTLDIQKNTGFIYGGMVETTFSALDTTNGRELDTVMCASYPGQVILGWRDIIDQIKLQERIEVYIPSALAYGATSSGIIPANTPILFEIEAYAITDSLIMDDRCN